MCEKWHCLFIPENTHECRTQDGFLGINKSCQFFAEGKYAILLIGDRVGFALYSQKIPVLPQIANKIMSFSCFPGGTEKQGGKNPLR